ncbi:ABC transporter permease [Acuticoccus sp. I52.16.1]|uniref:ABC transporter permease n=1 Tax=Acuticoccus sp. I52.16.1 TaxID=2928472 RepID=UPI001FCFE136|nr:ABC transporter permease subunit [Acuticoccus sp. I52.16.1]UOM32936.1 ABC transporter permease subunit [Acuticoccus sp. I52.16.1]
MTAPASQPEARRRGGGGRQAAARVARAALKSAVAAAVLVGLWWGLVYLLQPPRYVFPAPADVWEAYVTRGAMLARNTAITAAEIVIGLGAGLAAGAATALTIAATPLARRLVLPVVVATQALPVFAIAPLLVVWLGYGMASKIAMAGLIIYFPVATAYAEAMSRVDPRLVDLARIAGATRWQVLWTIRAPGGLPGLAAGAKVAATVAPIGAVVGEWVGASAGLGFVMVNANARSQTGVMFAALGLLAVLALLTRALADWLIERLLWRPDA